MSWLTVKEASRLLGVNESTIRRRISRGDINHVVPGHGPVVVWLDTEAKPPVAEDSAETLTADRGDFKTSLKDAENAQDNRSGYGSTYSYSKESDKYVFTLRSKAKAGQPLVVSGDTVRALLLAYSNDGAKATLNELARTFGWHRSTVREVLAALGKTHDSTPFTDEDIATRSSDELTEDLIRLKEEKVARKAEKAEWDETKRLADKARHFEKFVAQRLEQVIQTAGIPKFKTVPRFKSLPDRFAVFCTPSDLHYGKAGWKGEVGNEEYSRDECHRRLLATTDAMLERVSRFGRPHHFLVGAGSDWFHIDNNVNGGSTTKGTPQSTDGTWARIFLEGSELAAEYIKRLNAVAPVKIFNMAGNHDKLSSLMLTAWLKERFRDSTSTVLVSAAPRHYTTVGDTLIGITHGEDVKDEKLPGLMAAEAAPLWSCTKHRLWFTGHYHTFITNEFNGVRVIHTSSLAGSDLWHAERGYTGNRKALTAYCISNSEGLIAELPVSAR